MLETIGTIGVVGVIHFLLSVFVVGGYVTVKDIRNEERMWKQVEEDRLNRTIAQHEKDSFETELRKSDPTPEDNL